jgi:hypothetical protein
MELRRSRLSSKPFAALFMASKKLQSLIYEIRINKLMEQHALSSTSPTTKLNTKD